MFQKKLYEIVRDPKTFLMDPEVEYLPQYEAWLEIIDDQLSMDRLSRQLSANPDLQRQYTKLVPDQVIAVKCITLINVLLVVVFLALFNFISPT